MAFFDPHHRYWSIAMSPWISCQASRRRTRSLPSATWATPTRSKVGEGGRRWNMPHKSMGENIGNYGKTFGKTLGFYPYQWWTWENHRIKKIGDVLAVIDYQRLLRLHCNSADTLQRTHDRGMFLANWATTWSKLQVIPGDFIWRWVL